MKRVVTKGAKAEEERESSKTEKGDDGPGSEDQRRFRLLLMFTEEKGGAGVAQGKQV